MLMVAVALHQGNFAGTYKIGAGSDWKITFKKFK
jgi:hypothetical protein